MKRNQMLSCQRVRLSCQLVRIRLNYGILLALYRDFKSVHALQMGEASETVGCGEIVREKFSCMECSRSTGLPRHVLDGGPGNAVTQ